jgi:hypothetical protein
MKPLQVLPLALCYLVFCGCTAEAHEQDHDRPDQDHENHDHDDHDHDHDTDKDHDHDHDTDKKAPASQPTKKTGKLDSSLFDHFGEGATEGKTVSPSELAANPAAYQAKHVRVKGEVTSVCKKKGCWLVVSDGKTRIRGFTRGHSYFVPKDCEGRTAVLEGTFSLTEESVAFRKHLLEDEGRFEEAKKITEPNKNALKLDAVGIALSKVAAKK